MMMKILGDYTFQVLPVRDSWMYAIVWPNHAGLRHKRSVVSDKKFDCPGDAENAAIGHITLLEKGEPNG